jgi:DNA primase
MADQVLQDIKDKLDIIDVIGGYIQTKRSGTNFKAVCPFHNEKSASLMISPQKQIWHCFGCGEGGDIFGFVMRYEGIEFREALNILAAKAGVTLPAYNSQSQTGGDETRKLIIRINTFAAKVYHAFLMNETLGKQPRDYLANRGLKQETIESWGIGFAPNDFHALEQELVKKSVKSDQAILA